VIPIARRRLARHAGRRAIERDRVIAAFGTTESAIASESEEVTQAHAVVVVLVVPSECHPSGL
jgi:hypothetical protein